MRLKSIGVMGVAIAMATAPPGMAQDKPLSDKKETMQSAVTTPVEDLNLLRDKIPEILRLAQKDPYNLGDSPNCEAIAAEVVELNRELGEDYDEVMMAAAPKEASKGPSAADLVKAGVAQAIPFRGIVRQLSGAASHDKAVDAAIDAGLTRRGFLKGRALEMNCASPASPVWFTPRPKPAPTVAVVPPAEVPTTAQMVEPAPAAGL